ncbi:MAG: hypothetical protein ACTSUE_06045 [Promethearchaeota archaeon]
MNVKKFIKKSVFDSGDSGIRLDALVDKANRQFINKYISAEFILDYLKEQSDIELFFTPASARMIYTFKKKD